MDCGGKRSATPLSHARRIFLFNFAPLALESAVVAALCRRSPKHDAAPTELGILFRTCCYKDAAPPALLTLDVRPSTLDSLVLRHFSCLARGHDKDLPRCFLIRFVP